MRRKSGLGGTVGEVEPVLLMVRPDRAGRGGGVPSSPSSNMELRIVKLESTTAPNVLGVTDRVRVISDSLSLSVIVGKYVCLSVRVSVRVVLSVMFRYVLS